MERLLTEILHYTKNKADKIYILELLQTDDDFQLYETSGNRTHEDLPRKLIKTFDSYSEAEDYFELCVIKKIRTGFEFLQEWSMISIPGFLDALASTYTTQPTEAVEEHRKLPIC
jgi:hypothetical protein